ncbi:MAG: carbonic anhydrase family protein [Rhodocyclaceae bacterium]
MKLLPTLLILLALSPAAPAADWLTVTKDRIRSVELDRDSITAAEAGSKVAWGRIVLSDEQAKAYGYRSVRALNRYDCRSHSFIIVKRVYVDDQERTLREDRVDATQPVMVQRGTVDDRFFSEVCKPPTMANLRDAARDVADKLSRNQNESAREPTREPPRDQPRVRRADLQLARDDTPSETPSGDRKERDAAPAVPVTPASGRSSASSRRPAAATSSTSAAASSAASPTAPAAPAAPTAPASHVREAAAAGLRVAVPPPVRPAAAMTSSAARSSVAAIDPHTLEWSYEGPGGPENWGKLDPGFATCEKGERQSPIDIRDGIRVDQEAIAFNYKPSYFRIVDNGHTIQVRYGVGSTIKVMNRTYELQQFHFHLPAEERVNGRGFAMVAHLVHKDIEGKLAVLAILIEPGEANPLVQTLWNNLPLEKKEEYEPDLTIKVADLLPQRREYYSYIGSLTTPPCTEGVLWLVLKEPMTLSADQIEVFRRFYAHNARPVQPTAGRVIKESR